MEEWKLTGKRRFRLDDRQKLILQVQEDRIFTYHIGTITSEYLYRWRDAEVQDLSQHEETKP